MTLLQKPRERAWRPVEPARAKQLTDARLELHHAAQLVAGFGISYLEKRPDDSHTNMEWMPALDALASNPAGPQLVRIALRPRDLTLLAVGANVQLGSFGLHARTMTDAAAWIRRTVTQYGFAPDAYTLAKHYTIPSHAVAEGRIFDARGAADFAQLDHWFSNASMLLDRIASAGPSATPVRCWPHHFDIATLLELPNGASVGVGLEPGDQYYDEPYWYVNMYPSPSVTVERPPLDGGGIWHTREWLGAVLPASRVDNATQEEQCALFLKSAIAACRQLMAI